MKILLSGASGFLGKIIYEELIQFSDEVVTISRTRAILNVDLVEEVPILTNVDLVVHSAGKAHFIPKTEAEKKVFFDVNVTGTDNLLKGLCRLSILPSAFVFISTVAVYGCESGRLIDEACALNAKDPYGLSKIKAETLVTEWCKKHNVICTILRLPLLVGENPPGNLGAMIKAIKKGYYFNIGGGNVKKSMVLAEDVAKFILKVADFGGVYNLTDGIHPTFRELSVAIAKKKQLNLPLFFVKLIACLGDFMGDKAPINSSKLKKITTDLTFDDSKAKKILNWNPESVVDYLKRNTI
jgi:nucleoside-diphosphate-sugar epimerase